MPSLSMNRFITSKESGTSFEQQYFDVYRARLNIAEPKLRDHARENWPGVPVFKLVDSQVDTRCVVVGTLFKSMSLRPSILREVCSEHDVFLPQPARYTCDEDELLLEDESQRISLCGNIKAHEFVTGVPIALLGIERESKRGYFDVEAYTTLEPASLPEMNPRAQDELVLFVSGLHFGTTENVADLRLLMDFVNRSLDNERLSKIASQIVQIVVVGNSLNQDLEAKEKLTTAKFQAGDSSMLGLDNIGILDTFLERFLPLCPVMVMPGDTDPTNYILPQQPLHQSFFPLASAAGNFTAVTNPYQFDVNGARFLGHSGQPLDDIHRCSQLDDRLEILGLTLKWGHLAPSAPDTLGSYPFTDRDPFIIDEAPHVLFAGNQPEFATKLIPAANENGGSTRLICIPRFSTTSTCAVYNIRTQMCAPLKLDASDLTTNDEDN